MIHGNGGYAIGLIEDHNAGQAIIIPALELHKYSKITVKEYQDQCANGQLKRIHWGKGQWDVNYLLYSVNMRPELGS
jgi:hypothetical protein